MARSFLHIPGRFLKGVLLLALALVVLFFALTRTQVGRNELRQQLQHQFNSRFAGTLQIGTLQGNLVNTLFATNVRLLTPDGAPFLTIDSLVARPHWSSLFAASPSLRSIRLYHPEVFLHRRADGTWNAQRVFARVAPRTDRPPPHFTLAELSVRAGILHTTYDGPRPAPVADGWLFNYAATRATNIRADLTVEWIPYDELVEITDFSARLPEQDVQIDHLRGQMLGDSTRWAFNQLHLRTGGTSLNVDATLARPFLPPSPSSQTAMALDVAESRISFDEMRRLLPQLPLADTAMVDAHVQGPLGNLTIDALRIARGDSYVATAGTLRGLPAHLDFDVTIPESTLLARDVRAVWPALDLPPFDGVGALTLSGRSQGRVPFASDTLTWRATTEVAAQSQAGSAALSLQLVRRPHLPLRYRGTLRADTLNLAAVLPSRTWPSRLTGRLHIDGQGVRPQTTRASLTAQLTASQLAGRPIDSLTVSLQANRGRFEGDMAWWHPDSGYAQARGTLNLDAAQPAYTLALATEALNLEMLPWEDLPATRLNTALSMQGQGATLPVLAGSLAVAVDSSWIAYAAEDAPRLIAPHRSTLHLTARGATGPRLRLGGDVATLQVDGEVAFRPLWALGRLWHAALHETLRQELDKPFARPLASTALVTSLTRDPAAAAETAANIDRLRAQATAALQRAGYTEPLSLTAAWSVQRSDVLAALLPRWPGLRTDAQGALTVSASADELSTRSQLQGTRFRTGALDLHDPHLRWTVTGNLKMPLAETLSADLQLTASEAHTEAITFYDPHLRFDYLSRQASLRFDAARNGETGPFRLGATADLRPGYNEITLHNLFLQAGGHAWTMSQPSTLVAYADALVIPSLRLHSAQSGDAPSQRLRIHGTFSPLPTDTVHAEARQVVLQPFSELADLQRPIGGILNGEVALTGGWNEPRLRSQLAVGWLSFDRRLLGHLSLNSRYAVGSPDILVEATLRPEHASADSLQAASASADSPSAPSYLPYTLRAPTTNRIRVTGRMRLPSASPAQPALAATPTPPAPLDLALTIDRADLFFFEYIFEDEVANVTGYVTGEGHISGSWSDPHFQADLQAVDANFNLPDFNLHYQLTGPVQVDREGIKLNGVDLEGPGDGAARLNGAVLFNRYEYFSFDLQAQLDELQIIDVDASQDLPFYGSIWASGMVMLTGPLSDATLRSNNARTTPDSELFIPVSDDAVNDGTGFIIFADSTGQIPSLQAVTQRSNILADRPQGEPTFLDGLDLDLNLEAPQGSTVNLVFDPLLGDMVTAVGSGRVQIQRQDGEFLTYGTFEVNSGEYLFTAGEVFTRRFTLDGGTITWDGSPTNARLDLNASYRTRASTAGLARNLDRQRIPVVIQLDITGRVESPLVDLSLTIDSRDRTSFADEALENIFNQPDLATDELATEYATSVLLTNTFLLTTSSISGTGPGPTNTSERLTNAGNQLAFNSLSQLVASQLNRYLSAAVPNLDVNLGVQSANAQDLDVIYGVALRLLDERLIIRGEGVYQGNDPQRRQTQGLEGEFVVEVRLSDNVSAEVFYRRAGNDLLNGQTLTNTTGAGLTYETIFTTWRSFLVRLFGWLVPGGHPEDGLAAAPASASAPDSTQATPRATQLPERRRP